MQDHPIRNTCIFFGSLIGVAVIVSVAAVVSFIGREVYNGEGFDDEIKLLILECENGDEIAEDDLLMMSLITELKFPSKDDCEYLYVHDEIDSEHRLMQFSFRIDQQELTAWLKYSFALSEENWTKQRCRLLKKWRDLKFSKSRNYLDNHRSYEEFCIVIDDSDEKQKTVYVQFYGQE